ncbi:hypothetical protein [Candidatus Mycobacterium methanotrophicum]|uniref:hypothetical protein n=1 Tax=Candidatus Mycobacterium methanotrophicum TaxID=2943498 RepID=UPI003516253A
MIVTSTSDLRNRRASRRAHSKPVNPLPTITTDVTVSTVATDGGQNRSAAALRAATEAGSLRVDSPETVTRLLLGALTRGSMLIANSANPLATRHAVHARPVVGFRDPGGGVVF